MSGFSRFQDEEEPPQPEDYKHYNYSYKSNDETSTNQDVHSEENISAKDQITQKNDKQDQRASKNIKPKYSGVSTKDLSQDDANYGLNEILSRPLNDALIFEIVMVLLKMSRIILIMGLLLKLFTELNCQTSNIHCLLLCAFLRDIASGLFDIRCIFTLSSIRLKLIANSIDYQVQIVSRRYFEVACKKEGRFEDMKAMSQQCNIFANQQYQSLISLLKGCYHFLFFVSVVFMLKYDDEVFCHVFEKFAVIYLFLQYYVFLLQIALLISAIGVIPGILIIVLLGVFIRTIYQRYRIQKNIDQIRKLANNQLKPTALTQSSNQSCSLCSCNYLQGELSTQLNCSPVPHNFHHECITKWISSKDSKCPVCSENKQLFN